MTSPTSCSQPADDLALALGLADAADRISLPRFGASDLTVATKPDMTPVSDADTAVERAIRERLAIARPADSVLGEEFGAGPSATGGRTWVIDPIDATKNFVRGVPIWATLIALVDDGTPVLGVVSAPALARRWWGSVGTGAFTRFADGPSRPCHVSAVANVSDASMSFSELPEWHDAGREQQLRALVDACWRSRSYGDFYSYVLVAEGAVDMAAEPELSLWDLAAPAAVVIAAGGTFTDIDGAAISPATTSALATNGMLHDAALSHLAAGT